MTALGPVTAILRYPVSSLAGEPLSLADLDATGVPHDRAFGLVESATGEVAAPEKQQRWRPAAALRARAVGDGAELDIATDGGWLPARSDAARVALGAHMGFPVDIRPFSEGGDTATPRYERAAVHVATTGSLVRLQALLPASRLDMRRFRPNIVIDSAGGDAFPDEDWTGREIAVGGATLKVFEPSARCGFTLIEQDDLPYDPEVLRMLKRHNGGNFGVRCHVVRPGRVAIGDEARLH